MRRISRGVTPGLPTNDGSFKATERAESRVALADRPAEVPRGVDADWFTRLDADQQREMAQTGTLTVIDTDGQPVKVRPGVLDDDAEYVFRNGQCLALAAAMSKQTGWPVVLVPPHPSVADDYEFRHAYVQTPDGSLLDVGEAEDAEVLQEIWEDDSDGETEYQVETWQADQVDSMLAYYREAMAPQDVTAAEPTAAAVIANFKAGGFYGGPYVYDSLSPADAKALIDPDMRTRYTAGDCGVLAHYLAQWNGWGVLVVGDYEIEEYGDHTYYGVERLQHAYAVRPDGLLVDVEGVHDREAADRLAQQWGTGVHAYPDAASADQIWNHQQWIESNAGGYETEDGYAYDDEYDQRALAQHVAALVTIAYGEASA